MIFEDLIKENPILLALFGGIFTWLVTSLGAALVFFFKNVNRYLMNIMLGFAAGVMIAASFFSLLKPSVEIAESQGIISWIPAVVGFLLGGAFFVLLDKILPHLHIGRSSDKVEGLKTSWKRSMLLIMAITIHNIPEGLAVGVAFGALANSPDIVTLTSAVAVALGIGLQDFPEGAAISIPLRREGFSRGKAFFIGQLSGFVEPIAAVIGAYLVVTITQILPYALAFAAGAMIFVVIEELIPESQQGEESDFSTIGALVGFALMMFLDISLS